MYIPSIGDVIMYCGRPAVVMYLKKYEPIGSCSYDRKYLLCDLDYLENQQGLITMSDLEKHGSWFTVQGQCFPDIEKVDVAPFDIENVECMRVRRKTAKTVTTTVYE